MKKSDKKGSHVGVIASFALFVFFLITLYFIMQPMLKTPKDKQLMLDDLKRNLINEFSANLTTMIIYSPVAGSCLEISNVNAGVGNNSYAIVKNNISNLIASKIDQDKLTIAINSENFLWVYYSEVPFQNPSTNDAGCINPEIKSIRTNKEVFQKKIEEGIGNFEGLKNKTKLPVGNQFAVSFQYNNGTIISAGEKEVAKDVYAGEFAVQYIDDKANNLAGKMIIQVW
jgi:hypothetical protein